MKVPEHKGFAFRLPANQGLFGRYMYRLSISSSLKWPVCKEVNCNDGLVFVTLPPSHPPPSFYSMADIGQTLEVDSET